MATPITDRIEDDWIMEGEDDIIELVKRLKVASMRFERDRAELLAVLKSVADQLDKLGHKWQAHVAYTHISRVETGE